MLRFCLPFLFVILFVSCLSEPDCVLNASTEVKIALRVAGHADSAQFVKFDRIEVTGTDAVFHEGDSVSSVVLPVDPVSLQTTFRFYYEIVQGDTLTVFKEDSVKLSYTRSTRIISPDCGAFNYYQDLMVILSTFSSVVISNPELSISNATNLTIQL